MTDSRHSEALGSTLGSVAFHVHTHTRKQALIDRASECVCVCVPVPRVGTRKGFQVNQCHGRKTTATHTPPIRVCVAKRYTHPSLTPPGGLLVIGTSSHPAQVQAQQDFTPCSDASSGRQAVRWHASRPVHPGRFAAPLGMLGKLGNASQYASVEPDKTGKVGKDARGGVRSDAGGRCERSRGPHKPGPYPRILHLTQTTTGARCPDYHIQRGDLWSSGPVLPGGGFDCHPLGRLYTQPGGQPPR